MFLVLSFLRSQGQTKQSFDEVTDACPRSYGGYALQNSDRWPQCRCLSAMDAEFGLCLSAQSTLSAYLLPYSAYITHADFQFVTAEQKLLLQ